MRPGALLILTLALLCGAGNDAGARKQRAAAKTKTERTTQKKRTSGDIRRERKRTAGEIEQTQQQINSNMRETRRQLSRLAGLEAEISRNESDIANLQTQLDSIEARIGSLSDSIAEAEKHLGAMRGAYARSLKAMRRRHTQLSPIAFILGAGSISDAYRRRRYLQELSQAHTTKARRVRAAATDLERRRTLLDDARTEQKTRLDRLAVSRNILNGKRMSADTLVASLKREGASLKRVLSEKRRQAAQLDAELDRIIAAEAEAARKKAAEEEAARKRAEAAKKTTKNKPAATAPTTAPPATAARTQAPATDRALSGSFASNKGRLLFPVAGKHRIVSRFGRTKHPSMPGVEIQNSGIDIETSAQAEARAVFDGEVTSVFRIDGYQNIVILRHGEYLTVYAGLDRIDVRKGDKVKAAQSVGRIYSDPDNDGRSILHFELRREKQKLNPAEWVKP